MKLPFTDKFLWDLYNFLEKIGDIHDIFALRPWNEVWNLELHKFRHEYKKRQGRKNFSQLIYYLKKKGFIKIKNLEQKQAVLITKKGADKVLKIRLKTKEKKRRPDGKWQMIIFDIPEKKKQLRELLRESLYLLKYRKLQQSVWVCPYDVLKETEAILRRYSLDPYVKLFLIEEIEV
jgi:phenylacetic acid degradation operon negative regulatory protein